MAVLKASTVDPVATSAFTVHAIKLLKPSGSPYKNNNFPGHPN
jgi:hypothetical protein